MSHFNSYYLSYILHCGITIVFAALQGVIIRKPWILCFLSKLHPETEEYTLIRGLVLTEYLTVGDGTTLRVFLESHRPAQRTHNPI